MNKGKDKHRNRRQSGNAIVMLFAAIGMAGVVTYGLNNVIRGPAVTTAEVSRRTIAENNLIATTRLAIASATHQQASGGDCDGDGFIEPIPYRDAGAGVHPTGGGYIPSNVGASMADPWGNQYGYCAWDPGTVSVSDADPACGGATPRRLQGAPRDDQYAIAVISAGRNGLFETECRNFVDANVDNVPDNIMLETTGGSDDVVLGYTYAEANGIGGGEWKLKVGTPGTAEIGRNIALGSASNPRGAAFTDGLALDGAHGLILPRDPGDDTVTGACNDDKLNQLRLNIGDGTAVPELEICFDNAWTVVSGGAGAGGGNPNCGTVWEVQTAPNQVWDGIVFANNQFVATAGYSGINSAMTSPDGITWTQRTTPFSGGRVAYGSSRYVSTALDGSGNIMTSEDGITWTSRASPGAYYWSDIVYGGGQFIAIGDTSNVAITSPDGITWTQRTLPAVADWRSITYGGGTYLAAAVGNATARSTDGITWTSGTGVSAFSNTTAFGNGVFVSGYSNNIEYSSDAISWTPSTTSITNVTSINFLNDQFIATNYNSATFALSDDGITWTDHTAPQSASWADTAYGNGKYVVVAEDGSVMTSECEAPVVAAETAPPPTPYPLDEGLIAHWRMDEGTGTTVADSVGENDGTFINTPSWVSSGPVGASSLFMKKSATVPGDAVRITGLLDEPVDGTIALWVNTAQLGATYGADIFSIGNNVSIRERIPGSGGLSFIIYTGSSTWYPMNSGVSITGTGWRYVVATWDQTENMYRLYLDGMPIYQEEYATPIDWTAAADTYIGRHPDNAQYNYNLQGGVDDARVYNRALSPLEVQALYERSLGGSEVRKTTQPAALLTSQYILSASGTGSHACALKQDGSAWCWGGNGNGRLGINSATITSAVVPTKVRQQSIQQFKSISAGSTHTCGVTADNTGWCWGVDTDGQRGDGATTTGDAIVPTAVSGGTAWSQISAGNLYTCAVNLTSVGYCWGADASQQLGNGASTTSQTSPVAISGGGLYQQIEAGDQHTCGIRTDGSAYCWGLGTSGQIGNGASATQNVPTAVLSNRRWKDISVDTMQTCAVSTDGGLFCWGAGINTPTRIASGETWEDVEVGRAHTCATNNNGALWCWGTDDRGQLGNGTVLTATQTVPVRVNLPGPVIAFSAGNDQTCAMDASSALWCWGRDFTGSLGNGAATADQPNPDSVVSFPNITPWVWSSAATSFQLNGNITLALGDKWLSDDGTAKYFGFESAGKARLSQTGVSNQLLVETAAATNSAQVSYKKGTPGAAPTDYTTGRIADWAFNGTAVDSVGAFNGTLAGTTSYNTTGGRVSSNQVLEFEGAGRVSVANAAGLRPTTFTVSLWMRANNVQKTGATVLSKTHTNNTGTQKQTYGFEFDAAGNIIFATGITGVQDKLASATPVRLNSWVHVVGVYEPGGAAPQKRLYINGVLSGAKAQTTALVYDTTAAGNLFLGAAGCTVICQGFSGAIDDVRIYNTALTDAQVSQVYAFQSSSNAVPQAIGIDHGTNNLEIARQNATATDWLSTISPDLALTSTGTLGMGTATPATAVDVAGGVRVGYDAACTATGTGAIRYNGNVSDAAPLLSCTGTGWTNGTATDATALVFNALAYGQGKFIAPDSVASGNFYQSSDGISWVRGTGMTSALWRGIAYGNGIWVAVGTAGSVTSSPDGLTWTARSMPGAAVTWNSVTYGNGVFIATSNVGSGSTNIARSTDGITWTRQTTPAGSNQYMRAAYGNNVWVAVSNNNTAALSSADNGVTWTARTAAANTTWNSVTFGNNIFVATAASGQIMTSADGITWTSRTPSTGGLALATVNYGGGAFWTMGNSSTAMSSRNGIVWTNTGMPDSRNWIAGAYGAGRLATVASTGTASTRYAYSTCTSMPTNADGSTLPTGAIAYWRFDETSGTTAIDSIGGFTGTLQGNAVFAPGQRGNAVLLDGNADFVNMASPAALDNLTAVTACAWVNGPASQAGTYQGIVGKTNAGWDGANIYTGDYGGGTDLDVGVLSRANGYKQKLDQIPPNTWANLCMTWDGTMATSGLKMYVNGTQQISGFDFDVAGSASPSDAANNFVVGGNTGASDYFQGLIDEVVLYNRVLTDAEIAQVKTATSPAVTSGAYTCTGQNWEVQTNISVTVSLAFGNGLFVAAGGYPDVLATSPDGQTWTARSAPGGTGWFSEVAFGGGQFVAVSDSGPGRVITSPDGINWTARTAAELNNWSSLTYGGGLFAAVAPTGTNRVMTSPDGITWTARSVPARGWGEIAYGNGMFVAIDGSGYTMTSTDGITWTENSTPGVGNGKIAFGNGQFLISSSDLIQTTANGVALVNQTVPQGNWYGMTYIPDSSLWVAVAYNGTYRIMTSPDGTNWVAQTVPSTANFNQIAYGNGYIVAQAGDGTIMTSACTPVPKYQYCNGTAWTDFSATANPNFQARLKNKAAITAGSTHACGIKNDGTAWCWGNDVNGRLGNGAPTADQTDPGQVTGTGTWKQISTETLHSCGIKNDGTAWCWGNDANGRLGNGAGVTADQPDPVQVTGTGTWTQISVGSLHTCGIKNDGTAWCWGNDGNGRLGNGAPTADQPDPVQVTGTGTWTQISAGGGQSCGIKNDGTAWCWGRDVEGQLGDGAPATDQSSPVQVTGTGTWTQISAGGGFTCGIKMDGTAWCWGNDLYNQLGNGAPTADQPAPTQVTGTGTWTQISAGDSHACGIKNDATAWCWGYNNYTQLGTGAPTDPNPLQVTGTGAWTQISAGHVHTCGIQTSGTAWCWGYDGNGILGNGSVLTATQPAPSQVLE